MTERELVAVGRIGRARGIKGAVFVEPLTDDPEVRFVPGATVSTEPATAGPLTVVSSSAASGKLVVHFGGIDDRNTAEALRGTQLLIPAEVRPALDDPDDFYDTDLIGLAARRPDGTDLGPVRDVLHAKGADYLVLEVDGREVLVPFVSAIVPSVDVPGGTLVVDPPEGLLEL
jgi:16S rRNA processing protein RimM